MVKLNRTEFSKTGMLPEKQLSKNRLYYIAEAGLEYLISLLITGAFLALLLTSNGVPDSVAGIITELAAFAFSAQLVSVFFRKRRGMKLFITVLHLINQVMFVLLYVVPVINIPSSVKVVIIVVMFLGGQIIANVVSPYKISWFMSFVDDKKRGSFTANKEIVSLAAGTVFSMVMGAISDHYKALGKDEVYFAICAVTIFVLAVLHMMSIILVKDVEICSADETEYVKFTAALKKTFSNKALIVLILMDIIWQFGSKLSLAYYGVYENNVLGFSMKYIAFLGLLSAVSRIAFSRYFGKLADKYSWKKMLAICFAIAMVSFAVNIFTVPSNGKYMFAVYSCIHSVSMAGINSGLMNIIFDYVPVEDRAPALGIRTALGGVSAFLSTFLGAYIVHSVQAQNNVVFGVTIYPQQILSAISTVICGCVVLYVIFIVGKLKR